MSGILDRIARVNRRFRPSTYHEYFALQFANKLADTSNLSFYLSLCEKHPFDLLLHTYRCVLKHNSKDKPSDFFYRLKSRLTENNNEST